MMSEAVDIGSVSSRGQVAIPLDIRNVLGLEEGSKVLFVVEGDTLIVKKVTASSFTNITRPLKDAAKKSGLKESDVTDIVHKFRKERRA